MIYYADLRYYKQRVYVGLGDGTIAVFDPQHPTTGHTHLIRVSSAPIVACISSGGRLLVASLSSLYYINTVTMEATVSGYISIYHDLTPFPLSPHLIACTISTK